MEGLDVFLNDLAPFNLANTIAKSFVKITILFPSVD